MEVLEIVLLIVAYTLIVITLFLEIICYQRNLESLETIYLTISLLLLIVSLTVSYFFQSHANANSLDIFIQLSMILVGLTTPLNVLEERHHQIHPIYKKWLIGFASVLIIATTFGFFIPLPAFLEIVVALFMGIMVFGSMLLIRMTKPRVRIDDKEKMERIMAIILLIFVPLSLISNYAANLYEIDLKIGFTIPLIFIILTGHKLWEDIQRLSLFKPENTIWDQNLNNYHLTKREQEVAALLVKGTTYAQISELLFISMPTVKSHTTNIYQKCKTKNRAELISLLTK